EAAWVQLLDVAVEEVDAEAGGRDPCDLGMQPARVLDRHAPGVLDAAEVENGLSFAEREDEVALRPARTRATAREEVVNPAGATAAICTADDDPVLFGRVLDAAAAQAPTVVVDMSRGDAIRAAAKERGDAVRY